MSIDYGSGLDDINLLRPFGDEERQAVTRQMTELARSLFEQYGDQKRTFILANNEADEKLMEIANYTRSTQLATTNLIEWINTRQAAIAAVREEFPDARLRLLHAFELSVVNLEIGLVRGRFRKTARGADGRGDGRGVARATRVAPAIARDDLRDCARWTTCVSPRIRRAPSWRRRRGSVPASSSRGRSSVRAS